MTGRFQRRREVEEGAVFRYTLKALRVTTVTRDRRSPRYLAHVTEPRECALRRLYQLDNFTRDVLCANSLSPITYRLMPIA